MTVLSILKSSRGAVLVDTLSARTGLTTGQVLGQLTLLELNGQAKSLGGRWEYVEAPKPKAKARGKKTFRRSSSKPVRSSGKTIVTEQCGCRTMHRDTGSGRFVKQGK